MKDLLLKSSTLVFLILLSVLTAAAQVDAEFASRSARDARKKDEPPPSFSDMLARKKAEQAKKEHEEMLQRADSALELTTQLESSFERSNTLTSGDLQKLADLEKLVIKIRKEMGAEDGDDPDGGPDRPADLAEAFRYLQSNTLKLVNELKKTTRFSISAAAIQTSNGVLKVVRFLRLKK